ncbi:MAG: protein-disulfide reductase DsbD domain-containing protein, partial [Hyphococcus sp.]
MFLRLLFFIALLSCSTGLTARAQSVAETDYTTTEILSEHEAFAPGETLWFAVRQDVRDGWHVFWTNPGDAGIPLHLQWSLPAGYEAGAILHPAPEFIPVGPLASYAHEGAPVFLTSVTAPESAAPGDRVRIVIDAAWQACEQICVPEDAQLSFELPVVDKPALNAEARAVFEAARAALPAPHNGEATFARVGGVYRLQLSPWGEQTIDDAFFFPVIEGLTTPAAPQQADVLDNTLTIEMTPGWAEALSSPAITGVLTYGAEGTRKAISVTARVNGSLAPLVDGAPLSAAAGDANIAWYFLLAFLGGVILNIMPCVFPIIFVKASSFMESAHHNPGAMRAHGLVFTAGVLATFALMGGVLLALRAGGEQLGWGFHLQSPIVVALSAYVLFMGGLNRAGLFTVGEGLAGAGDSLTRKRGAVGAFFTGALAVVVAAPCIGPLLTAPMGAALMQPPVVGMTIFLLMGLGLAAPYLVLSFAPAAGGLLPRPGPWMS